MTGYHDVPDGTVRKTRRKPAKTPEAKMRDALYRLLKVIRAHAHELPDSVLEAAKKAAASTITIVR